MRILIIILSLLIFQQGVAQVTVSFKPGPDVGKDAEIVDNQPNLNINDNKLSPYSWTHSSIPVIHRSQIEFTELSTIPTNAIIADAKLKLFFKVNHPATPGVHSGANDLYIRRITSPWTETGITWNNQPTTTSLNEVLVPPFSTSNQDYTINVTSLVADMLTNNNYGFMMSLQNETPYRLALFASSDHSDPTLHPELEITYSFPASIKEQAKNTKFKIYPNPTKGIFDIELKQLEKNQTVEILNPLGQRIYFSELNATKTTIDLNKFTLSSGTYFVVIKNENSSYSEQLIIN